MIKPIKIKVTDIPNYSSFDSGTSNIKANVIENITVPTPYNTEVSYMDFSNDVKLDGVYVDENGKSFDAVYFYSSNGLYNVKYKDGIRNINIQFQVDGTKLNSEISYLSSDNNMIVEKINYNLNGAIVKETYENDNLKSKEITDVDGTITTILYDGDKIISEKKIRPDGSTLEKIYEYSKAGVIQKFYSDGVLENINITEDGHTFSDSEFNFGDIIIDFATSQIGHDGKKYWDYLKGGGFEDGSSTPWCACFISWILGNVSYNNEKLSDIIGHEGAGVYGFVTDASDKGILKYNDACPKYQGLNSEPYTPKPGDLVIFDWDKNWTKDPYEERDSYMNDHIGIVKEVTDDGIITIEGNADDTVKIKEYSDISSPSITLFIDWQDNI